MVKKSASTKKSANTKKSVKSTKTSKKRKPKKQTDDESLDSGIVIVDDEFSVDKNIINEERRAYLEEARSQDASE